MATPFYVSPEQMMKDRAEYARKGISRGRGLVALEYENGVVFIGENPSHTLYKTSEIYDRIGFAAVGKYNEFESMRVAGIRLADVKGYQYDRKDVSAKGLANAYSQALGAIFIGDNKPYEVELLIAQVNGNGDEGQGRQHDAPLELYHILYDGSLVDEYGHVAIGGEADAMSALLEERYEDGLDLTAAVKLGATVLSETSEREIPASDLEVSGLDRTRARRLFFRLAEDEVGELIDG